MGCCYVCILLACFKTNMFYVCVISKALLGMRTGKLAVAVKAVITAVENCCGSSLNIIIIIIKINDRTENKSLNRQMPVYGIKI